MSGDAVHTGDDTCIYYCAAEKKKKKKKLFTNRSLGEISV